MKFTLLLWLPFLSTGDSDVTASRKTVKVGDDAVLPCQMEGQYDKKTQKVEWTRNDKDVHLYRKGKDELDDQDKHFKGRTSLFYDEMAKGNISLKLSKVNEQDEGNYICYVGVSSGHVKQCDIRLNVEKRNTEDRRNAGPRPDPKPDTKPEPEQDHTKLGYIGFIILPIGIIGCWIWWRHRNNSAAQNRDYGPVERRDRNPGNQGDPGPRPEQRPGPRPGPRPRPRPEPVPGPGPGLGAEAGPEPEPEQRPGPGPGPGPGPVSGPGPRLGAEAGPEPGPVSGPGPRLGAEAGPEPEPEQRPGPGPGPGPGPEPEPGPDPVSGPGPEHEAEPMPGPNKDHGMRLSPYRRGPKRQSNQEKEHGQSQD